MSEVRGPKVQGRGPTTDDPQYFEFGISEFEFVLPVNRELATVNDHERGIADYRRE